jgi:hypothetical protein
MMKIVLSFLIAALAFNISFADTQDYIRSGLHQMLRNI